MKVTQSLHELQRASEDGNVQAWLRVIRAGESHPDDDGAYSALYGWSAKGGGPTFSDMGTHPRQAFMSQWGWTSAAGAYQAMATVPGKVKTDTWDNAHDWFKARGYILTMWPRDQDLFAIWCTARRGALPAVINGNIVLAMSQCRLEWASMPASTYGQPTKSAESMLAVYARHGGVLNGPAASPAEPVDAVPVAESHVPARSADGDAGVAPSPAGVDPAPPSAYQSEWDMQNPSPPEKPVPLPIAASLAIGLAQSLFSAFAPLAQEKLTKELSRHTDRPEVAAQVSQAAVSAAMALTGKADPVEAVITAKQAPAIIQQVQTSTLDELEKLAPLLERMAALDAAQFSAEEASREAAERRAQAGANDQDVFLTRSIVGLQVGIIAGSLLLVGVLAWLKVSDTVLMGVFAILNGACMLAVGKFGTRYDHRYGSSAGSASKDAVRDAALTQITRRQ